MCIYIHICVYVSRGSWKCLGRLIMDVVYSQYPISESDFDHLAEVAALCGYSDEFTTAFNMAVDGNLPLENGTIQRSSYTYLMKVFVHDDCLDHLPLLKNLNYLSSRQLKLYLKYPENPTRLHCFMPYLSNVYSSLPYVDIHNKARGVSLADILRVHEWSYIRKLIKT